MYDQDFINDGFADGRPAKVRLACPKCGRRITTVLGYPMPEKRCYALVRRTTPRAKGEPRMVRCDTVMIPDPAPNKETP